MTLEEYFGVHPDYYISEADRELAGQNEDFAKALMTNKDLWYTGNSIDKQTANTVLEELRKKYGGYTAGKSGDQRNPIRSDYLLGMSSSRGNALTQGGYSSRYQSEIDSLVNSMLNRPEFSYDYEKDPLWDQYKESYTREGERAMLDTIGQVSARTGGLSSSYATSAGAQANNYYMSQMTDKIPELYEAAYNRYMNEYSKMRSDLGALMELDSSNYGRYLDKYNMAVSEDERGYQRGLDERNFEYTKYLNDINLGQSERQLQSSEQQQRIENAMRIWQLYGYATPEVADILGVPEGTPTSDQAYDNIRIK